MYVLQKGLALGALALRARRTLSALHAANTTLGANANKAAMLKVFIVRWESVDRACGAQDWKHLVYYISFPAARQCSESVVPDQLKAE